MAGRAAALHGRNKAEAKPKEQQIREETETDLEERIRCRANEIYRQRGGQAGSELDDWLQAEQEIRGSKKPERAAEFPPLEGL